MIEIVILSMLLATIALASYVLGWHIGSEHAWRQVDEMMADAYLDAYPNAMDRLADELAAIENGIRK